MDPVTAAAVIGAGSSLVGSLSANAESKRSSREQMRFQERMSSTARQRDMADLKAAGLNPLMAAMGSGASTPSGANYNASNIAEGLASTATDIGRYRQEKKNAKLQNELTEEQTKLTKAQQAQTNALAKKTHNESRILGPKATLYEQGEEVLKKILNKRQNIDIRQPPKSFMNRKD